MWHSTLNEYTFDDTTCTKDFFREKIYVSEKININKRINRSNNLTVDI